MIDAQLSAAIEDALAVYHDYTADAVTVSTLEQEDSITPELLTEIRSAFTHIAKAVCTVDATPEARAAQIQDAKDHLVRAALDGFKIAIVLRLDKVRKHIRAVEKFTVLGRDIQEEFDACLAKRRECGLTENGQITGNPTVEDYAILYTRVHELHQMVSARMPENTHKNLQAVARLRAFYSTWSGWIASAVFCVVGFVSAVIWDGLNNKPPVGPASPLGVIEQQAQGVGTTTPPTESNDPGGRDPK